MDFKNLWVSEYSASQGCFHVTTLASALMANTNMVAEKTNNDYLMFGIFGSQEEADAACDAMTKFQYRRLTMPNDEPVICRSG